jgi:acyl-CoA thioester hydrolase
MNQEPHVTSFEVRFRDLDAMGHVNNAVYATYLEQARIKYYESILDISLGEVDTVIVHLEIDYIKSLQLGNTVHISLIVSSIGTSSVTMDYVLTNGSEKVATAKTVQVLLDGKTGTSTPIPQTWRDLLG